MLDTRLERGTPAKVLSGKFRGYITIVDKDNGVDDVMVTIRDFEGILFNGSMVRDNLEPMTITG